MAIPVNRKVNTPMSIKMIAVVYLEVVCIMVNGKVNTMICRSKKIRMLANRKVHAKMRSCSMAHTTLVKLVGSKHRAFLLLLVNVHQ